MKTKIAQVIITDAGHYVGIFTHQGQEYILPGKSLNGDYYYPGIGDVVNVRFYKDIYSHKAIVSRVVQLKGGRFIHGRKETKSES